MIDEIFEMIMKEARARPGKGIVRKVFMVIHEVEIKVTNAMDILVEDERRRRQDENKRSNIN
ncbi:hypothetical protein ES703_37882 [subsurface metagenome]